MKEQRALSGLELTLLCRALHTQLAGARLQKVVLSRDGDLGLMLYQPGQRGYLRLGCDHDAQWLFWQQEAPPVSKEGSPLRDKVEAFASGGRLVSLETHDWRRIVVLTLVRNEETFRVVLHAELPQRAIVLLDAEQRILARVGVLRGVEETYTLPDPGAGLPPDGLQDARPMVERCLQDDEPVKALLRETSGLSPMLVEQVHAAFRDTPNPAEGLTNHLQRLARGEVRPGVARDRDGNAVALCLDTRLLPKGTPVACHETWSEAVTAFWRDRLPRLALTRLRARVERALEAERKRLARTKEAILQELEGHQRALRDRHVGDLLASSFHLLKRGMTEIELQDYTREAQPKVRLSLDPKLTPQENLARYYKRAQRAERGVAQAQARLAGLEADMEANQARARALADVEGIAPLRELAGQLGLASTTQVRRKADERKEKEDGLPTGVRRYQAPSGHVIYVGRSAAANDTVLRRYARGNDLWLHAEGVTGAHVVIRRQGRDDTVPEVTITLAATVAALYSDAKRDDKVAVAVTQAKYVRKRKGDPPGRVTYSQERVVLVGPDPSVMARFGEPQAG